MKTRLFAALSVFLWLALSPVSQAATLDVVGGELQGAQGVTVAGLGTYNVTFLDGTCQEVFGGCDSVADFAFSSQADALLAAQALLDQVFIDGPSGLFDTDPELTRDCTFSLSCTAYIPYDLQGVAFNVQVVGAANKAAGQGADATVTAALDYDDFVPAGGNTFAVFTVVPVPAAVWLFGSALGLLGWIKRKAA